MIGCGRMGVSTSQSVDKFAPRCWYPLSHAQAIENHPDLELIAICDANPVTLQRSADILGITAAYTDYRTLIAEMQPELIGIATRTIGRADIVQTAANAGTRALHVEKPLCNSAQELAKLTEILAGPNLFCTYGALRRYFRIFQIAKELARSGAYGTLHQISVNFGRGMLFWTHPHSVDLILDIAGERRVEAVQARLSNVIQGDALLDILSDPIIDSASIYFEDGVVGHIGLASGFSLVISCSEAEISVENDGEEIFISKRQGENPYYRRSSHQLLQELPDLEGSLAPISHLVRCLQGDVLEIERNRRLKSQIIQGQSILFLMVQSHLEDSRLIRAGNIDSELAIWARTGEKFA